jgi:hypothetical protein
MAEFPDDATIKEVADRRHAEERAHINLLKGAPLDLDDPQTMQVVLRGTAVLRKIEPRVLDKFEVFECPQHALEKYNQRWTDGIGAATFDAIFHDMAARELLSEEQDKDTLALRAFCSVVHDTLVFVTDEQSEGVTCLIKWPSEFHLDDEGRLHSGTGPAIQWGEHQSEYFWHGVALDREVIEAPDTLTSEYLQGLAAEQRRATYEALGHEKVVSILEVEPVDSWTDSCGLHYELLSTERRSESWLRMQSPPLQDDSQPYYVEPVHEDCKNCAEALAWRATGRLNELVEYGIQT